MPSRTLLAAPCILACLPLCPLRPHFSYAQLKSSGQLHAPSANLFLTSGSALATISVINAEDTSQATKGIFELFKEFLVNLNFSLRCDDVQGWLLWIADVEAVFPRLSTRSGV